MILCKLLASRNITTPSPSKNQSTPTRLAQKSEAGWQGQVTAREVAKRARAHQLHVSNEVVRVSPVYQPPSLNHHQRMLMPQAAAWDVVDMALAS